MCALGYCETIAACMSGVWVVFYVRGLRGAGWVYPPPRRDPTGIVLCFSLLLGDRQTSCTTSFNFYKIRTSKPYVLLFCGSSTAATRIDLVKMVYDTLSAATPSGSRGKRRTALLRPNLSTTVWRDTTQIFWYVWCGRRALRWRH